MGAAGFLGMQILLLLLLLMSLMHLVSLHVPDGTCLEQP